MEQKEQRPIAHPWQTGAEAAAKTFDHVLLFNRALDLLPIHAKGRIREHIVELVAGKLVIAEGVAQLDAAHILPLDQHIALADRITLRV